MPSRHDEGSAGADPLASSLGRLARQMQQEQHPSDVLDDIVAGAVELIPGVDEASINVVIARRQVESRSASSELARSVDQAQAETGEGPCLDAAFEQETIRVPDLSTEQRWPAFCRRAWALGAHSMLSFQLFVEGDDLGALNLFSRETDAFTDDSEHVGLLFATHAAVAFAGARKQEQLMAAVGTRDLIGQAKGILMERYSIPVEVAFSVLTRYSRDNNRKLRDVSEELVRTRRLPG